MNPNTEVATIIFHSLFQQLSLKLKKYTVGTPSKQLQRCIYTSNISVVRNNISRLSLFLQCELSCIEHHLTQGHAIIQHFSHSSASFVNILCQPMFRMVVARFFSNNLTAMHIWQHHELCLLLCILKSTIEIAAMVKVKVKMAVKVIVKCLFEND